MSSAIDYVNGDRFGRWMVLRPGSPRGKNRIRTWRVRCDCGTERDVDGPSLRTGKSTSCGCYQREVVSRHRESYTLTYRAWGAMKSRCMNPANRRYHCYGERGIRVCDRWLTFENFLADMGRKPKGKSLDRINNDGNYEPGNCRWATPLEQGNNRSTCRRLEYNGFLLTVAEWTRVTGLGRGTIKGRLAWGWSIHEALTTPRQKSRYWRSKHELECTEREP